MPRRLVYLHGTLILCPLHSIPIPSALVVPGLADVTPGYVVDPEPPSPVLGSGGRGSLVWCILVAVCQDRLPPRSGGHLGDVLFSLTTANPILHPISLIWCEGPERT